MDPEFALATTPASIILPRDLAKGRDKMMTQTLLMDTIRKTLKLPKLDPDARMGSIRGWDSLRHVQLLLELERVCELEIPPDMFGTLTSVESIAGFLRDAGTMVD
jgi:acyl carrier protein